MGTWPAVNQHGREVVQDRGLRSQQIGKVDCQGEPYRILRLLLCRGRGVVHKPHQLNVQDLFE